MSLNPRRNAETTWRRGKLVNKKNEHKSWTITINTQNASKNGKFAKGDGKEE